MVEVVKCPKCDSEMEAGQLLDESYMTSGPQFWSKDASGILGLGVKGKRKMISFRCKKCGYIGDWNKMCGHYFDKHPEVDLNNITLKYYIENHNI